MHTDGSLAGPALKMLKERYTNMSLTHTCMSVHTYTHACTHMHTHAHARTHTRTHTHARTHAHTHARTHAHTIYICYAVSDR